MIGGGVIGCAIAWSLAGEGARVRVLERTGIAAESSGAAAGILAPRIHATDPCLFALAMESHRRLPPMADALREETGLDVEYVRTGVVELAHDAAGEEILLAKTRVLQQDGHDVQWLEAKDVLAEEPNMPVANMQYGMAQARLKNYAEALPPLQKASQLLPDNGMGRYELGLALFETGDWKGAAPQFEAAVGRAPKWADAHFSLAAVYARIDRVPEALTELDTTLSLTPNH